MLSKPAGNGSRRDRGHGRAMSWHAIPWQSCLPIWIVDPQTRTGRMSVGSPALGDDVLVDVWQLAKVLKVPDTAIQVDLDQLFAQI
jgi:hypothetical protein